MDDIRLAQKYLNKVQNARSREIAFKLSFTSYKNLMRAKKCYYTGLSLSDVDGAANQRTIDRIDSSRGYEKGNVVACCKAFNQMKGAMEKDGCLSLPSFQKSVIKMFNTVNKVTKV